MRVMKDERGRSRGFGFVNYANHEDAQKVVFLCLHLHSICYSTFKRDVKFGFSRLFLEAVKRPWGPKAQLQCDTKNNW